MHGDFERWQDRILEDLEVVKRKEVEGVKPALTQVRQFSGMSLVFMRVSG